MLKTYYNLTKPGIIYGNALYAAAGFLLAARGHVNLWLLLVTLAGISLVIASGCVTNNYVDRHIDQTMRRTKQRALAKGTVSGSAAITYAAALGLAGFGLLAWRVNWLTVGIGMIGFLDYVVLYSFWKRRSVYGTIIGSISGATPPLAGYTAVTGHLDIAAVLLFLILVCWQMPHFYAIALYRREEYAQASIPVWPLKRGEHSTKIQMVFYTAVFVVLCALLTVFGYTGYVYLAVVTLFGLAWLWRGVQGFRTPDTNRWARKMFGFSLLMTIVLSSMLAIGPLLP
ncbi:MAG TPA: heme o synthase [Candidatus Saccharimonadales bacterium]|nr:heme o synthase [Candidatus Saccharimonadales bacterium]